ncbi:hypothetical protein BCV72DRAFT_262132 [Rhizopus microsporus var. microsporus]|uniref:BTB domain-containing protein n=2 Tax=Rhizopus microsporus TaxID=58291 RepID=A0A2G4SEK0_RHIZD|nr:uncharacterized protein RHIMIDRAFT_296106 [Rhizopus microsporus ATCC 52813]ORE07358.1 hypothetical protein BCV72DRAFT_109221 [Rhizopus microsporus var. microsporus]ORE07360.1 hypothetical protein BCV72DRAFT_262132 [Rhizopus microsporus var. microsporus]PHZ07214.1 hypothetical protein RHIMIDRAFT_296106 [Rhizopus microsporus ATCC 52813]
MVQVLPINYNNEHYKPANFMNGEHNNYQHPTPPPHPHPPIQQHQQMPIPLPPVPMINHLMPHPHHPPGYFHPPPPPPHPHQPMYDQSQQYIDYANGAYPAMGFMYQGYSDISVYVPTLQKTYPLNSAILCRSPVLCQRIMEEQTSTLELDLYVLPETFHTIIGHLYRPLTPQEIMFFANEKPQIAIELLEAAEELGLEPLLDHLLLALNQNLNNQKTAMTYIEAMEPYQPLEEEEPRHWVETLEEDIVTYLAAVMPTQLEAFSPLIKVSGNVNIGQVTACGYMPSRTPPMRGFMDLARVYASLPQHLMIRCLESPKLPVQDAIQRSYFAKHVLSIVNSLKPDDKVELVAVLRFEKGQDTIAVVKQSGLKKGSWDPKLYYHLP